MKRKPASCPAKLPPRWLMFAGWLRQATWPKPLHGLTSLKPVCRLALPSTPTKVILPRWPTSGLLALPTLRSTWAKARGLHKARLTRCARWASNRLKAAKLPTRSGQLQTIQSLPVTTFCLARSRMWLTMWQSGPAAAALSTPKPLTLFARTRSTPQSSSFALAWTPPHSVIWQPA